MQRFADVKESKWHKAVNSLGADPSKSGMANVVTKDHIF